MMEGEYDGLWKFLKDIVFTLPLSSFCEMMLKCLLIYGRNIQLQLFPQGLGIWPSTIKYSIDSNNSNQIVQTNFLVISYHTRASSNYRKVYQVFIVSRNYFVFNVYVCLLSCIFRHITRIGVLNAYFYVKFIFI